MAGALAGLKSVTIPFLAKELASAGVTALGSSLGLNPHLSTLLAVPVAASMGGLSKGLVGPQGILTAIKASLFSSQTVGGLISVGASIGLDALGAAPILQSFIPGILGQLTAGDSGSTGGGGGGGPGNLLGSIGDFAKGIGQAVVNGAKKIGQTVVSFGQAIANGFGQAVEKVSHLIPPQIKEFFIGKGNGDLAAGVNSAIVTDGNTTESAFGNYRLTYDNVSNDLTFANERLTATVRNIELGQTGDIFTAGIEITENFGGGNLVREVYDNNGILQELKFNDDVEIFLNNNPFSKSEPLNFQNAITRLRLGGFDNDSFIEFRNIDGKFNGDIELDLSRSLSADEAIGFINDLALKVTSIESALGIPEAFADDQEKFKGALPPPGKYAVKFFVERPYGNEFGDNKIITHDDRGRPSTGHTFVALADSEGRVIYRGLYPVPGANIFIDPSAPLIAGIFGAMISVSSVTSDVEGIIRNDFDMQSGQPHDYDVESDWYVISDESKYNAVFNYLSQMDVKYNLCFNSCTGFAQRIAELANIEIPNAGIIANPQNLADAFEREEQV